MGKGVLQGKLLDKGVGGNPGPLGAAGRLAQPLTLWVLLKGVRLGGAQARAFLAHSSCQKFRVATL